MLRACPAYAQGRLFTLPEVRQCISSWGFLVAILVFVTVTRRVIFRRWRRYGRHRGVACGQGKVGRRWPFRALFRRLDTSPSQEQVLVDEATALREAFLGLRADWTDARRELGEILSKSPLDPTRVEKVLAGSDERHNRSAATRRRGARALPLDPGRRPAQNARRPWCARAGCFALAYGRHRC